MNKQGGAHLEAGFLSQTSQSTAMIPRRFRPPKQAKSLATMLVVPGLKLSTIARGR
jgi:hypothetical protein